eukprot:UN03823
MRTKTTCNVRKYDEVFAAVADTIEEPVNLEVDEEGFSLQAMDGSHVCLIDFSASRRCFQ